MKGLKYLFIIGITFIMLSGFWSAASLANSGSDQISVSPAASGPAVQFGEIITGKNSLYNGTKQDLSGAATHGKNIIFVDDSLNSVRVMQELPDDIAVDLPFSNTHEDFEGATWSNGYFVATTSLDPASNENRRRLTRFKLKGGNLPTKVKKEKSVDLRDGLMAALQAHFQDDDWFNRINSQPGKNGGLNIEGLSRVGNSDDDDDDGQTLLWGLRSPLFGDNFATKVDPDDTSSNPKLILDEGVAIIAAVHDPFGKNPSFTFQTVDLGNHGIRGMEWIPALQGYVIIGGPIPKGEGYSLWHWRPNEQPTRIYLPSFDGLCRPESVIQVKENGKKYLVVLSEESSSCNPSPSGFTFVQAEIVSDDGGDDDDD